MWPSDMTREGAPSLTAAGLLPFRGEACARVFHPARLSKGNPRVSKIVRWSDVAAANGTVMHPAAEWGSIVRSWKSRGQDGLWDRSPSYGRLDVETARALERVLSAHYPTDRLFRGAVWEGRTLESLGAVELGESGNDGQGAPGGAGAAPWSSRDGLAVVEACRERAARATFQLNGFEWLALVGTLPELLQSDDPELDEREPASMLWDSEGGFALATGIDLLSTYVTGTRALIGSLTTSQDLECLEIPFDQSVTWDSDTINLPVEPPF